MTTKSFNDLLRDVLRQTVRCVNCKHPLEAHEGEKCLFGPGTLKRPPRGKNWGPSGFVSTPTAVADGSAQIDPADKWGTKL